jgi:hypothetical protein
MKNTKKIQVITRKNFIEVLKNINTYQFANIDYTTELSTKMLKKERGTNIPNELIDGKLHKCMNVAALGTTNDEISGYQNRAENNGKGADFKAFREPWYIELSKVLVTDKKTQSKFYFKYEKLKNTRSFFSKIILNGLVYTGKIGDVWNKVTPNERGVEIRVINIDNINKISIDGTKYVLID